MERIQDFILQDDVTEIQEATVPAKRKKPEVSYEIAAKTNTDVVVKRKTSRTEKVLALIPSKNQYYIMAEDGTTTALSASEMSRFFSKMEEPLVVGLDWIETLEKGKPFAESVLYFLKLYREPVMAGLADKDFFRTFLARRGTLPTDIMQLYQASPKIALYLKDRKRTIEHRPPIIAGCSSYNPFACGSFEASDSLLYLNLFCILFGLDKTRQYVDRMIERDLNFSCFTRNYIRLMEEFYQVDCCYRSLTNYRGAWIQEALEAAFKPFESVSKLRNDERLDADAFTDYCLTYQAEGFKSLSHFVDELRDDWSMQRNVFGQIREKYPKNLSSHHNKLVLKSSMLSSKIDEKQFAQQYEKARINEWADDTYIIKAPSNAGEMVDEAMQQGNCLRSYIGRVIEGNTFIYFLRHKKTPDTSLVTVEVQDGQLVQVKGKFNKEPTPNQKKALIAWAKEKGFGYYAYA